MSQEMEGSNEILREFKDRQLASPPPRGFETLSLFPLVHLRFRTLLNFMIL